MTELYEVTVSIKRSSEAKEERLSTVVTREQLANKELMGVIGQQMLPELAKTAFYSLEPIEKGSIVDDN